MTTPLKTVILTTALVGALSSSALAQLMHLPGVPVPLPTQPVRLPFPEIPVKRLPSQIQNPGLLPISVQLSALPAVVIPQARISIVAVALPIAGTPAVVVPAQPAKLVQARLASVQEAFQMKAPGQAPKAEALAKVFDSAAAPQKPSVEPVDTRDSRVTLPEWELEQDLGIR